MKKYYFLATLAATALAGCTSDDFVGDISPSTPQETNGEIRFGLNFQNATRADIGGNAAAALLGNHFYLTGTKGTEGDDSPTPTIVFNNYLVHYGFNTAGTTESNTANWEYVGVTPGTGDYTNYVKLSSLNSQTIKYWDYSTDQYDFLAFSTGGKKAVSGTSTAPDNIGVTAMKYGEDLKNSATAYTFDVPSVEALKGLFITDITEVPKANYGKEVTLRFKNLGSKVRIALYETVPGYAVKDVIFYQIDKTNDFTDANKSTTATLISANNNGLPTNGTIQVFFPHVGNNNASEGDYNKAAGHVTSGTSYTKYKGFGTLAKFASTKEGDEADGNYLGRTLPTATFAGSAAADYYETVFPVSTDPLTLRVDYTLVSTDGSGEEIKVYGAKAVVPSTYVQWLPNYAYTYIFKISDNTNGWTDPTGTTTAGLFPITFDAVVTEATNATGEQTTITTVAAPTITTYQQNHAYTTNEYSKTTSKDVYVQVMDNSTAPANLLNNLAATNSLLYKVSDANATEAEVMDALEKRTTALNVNNVTGRNGITLTRDEDNIANNVTSIVNGADDNPITVAEGSAAKIAISGLNAGTYAYVYDYTTGEKNTVTEYQPLNVTVGNSITKNYKFIKHATLDNITATTGDNEAVDNDYIYFSKTTNGTGTTTYSYISVAGKTNLPAGLLKVAKGTLETTGTDTSFAANTFYFDTYISNNGKYAVKIIKIVE